MELYQKIAWALFGLVVIGNLLLMFDPWFWFLGRVSPGTVANIMYNSIFAGVLPLGLIGCGLPVPAAGLLVGWVLGEVCKPAYDRWRGRKSGWKEP